MWYIIAGRVLGTRSDTSYGALLAQKIKTMAQ